jgi:hypothetical protein
MPVVYTIAGAVSDWLLANNVDPGDGSMFRHVGRVLPPPPPL